MTKKNIAQISASLFDLLKDLDAQERQRAVTATMMLFGENIAPTNTSGTTTTNGNVNLRNNTNTKENADVTPKSYIDEKEPKNKGEALAVAARYRELYQKAETHTKAEIKEILTSARRNFDERNYQRDIKNAIHQAGYFNKNTDKGSDTLSYYGQNYVDALPDRETAKKISKPKIKSASKKKAKPKKLQSK